jgi:hypothetical protein
MEGSSALVLFLGSLTTFHPAPLLGLFSVKPGLRSAYPQMALSREQLRGDKTSGIWGPSTGCAAVKKDRPQYGLDSPGYSRRMCTFALSQGAVLL